MNDFKKWAIYTPNGVIDRIYSGPSNEAQSQTTGDESVIEIQPDLDDQNAYISNGSVVAKRSFSFSINKSTIEADGVDEAIISNLPSGTVVLWPDDFEETVTDGVIEFSVDQEGKYNFTFDHPHYLQETLSIEANTST